MQSAYERSGRPATRRASVMGVRLAPELRANVDKWAAEQPDKPSQSEAIRRLVELGLAGSWSIRTAKPRISIEGFGYGRPANRQTRRFYRNPRRTATAEAAAPERADGV